MQLFAERFKSARKLNGFSLQDLENKIGRKVSRQALHRYEKGEVEPTNDCLIILADAMGVRVDYFTTEKLNVIELESFQWHNNRGY